MIPFSLTSAQKTVGAIITTPVTPEPIVRTGPPLTGPEGAGFSAYPSFYYDKIRGAPAMHRRTAFTDMVAAPNGAPVTIYGVDVNGPIKIGGVTMPNTAILNEVVYDITVTGQEKTLYKTTAWIEGMPEGHTTIQAGNSPILPFYVNSGRVITCNSFTEYKAAAKDPLQGDVLLLKGFISDYKTDLMINGGNAQLWMRPDEHNGSDTMPIALIGYPNDPAKFLMTDGYQVGAKSIYQLDNTGWVIANLDFDCDWAVIKVLNDHRVVGNRMTGLKVFGGAGTGTIVGQGESVGGVMLGNMVFGGRSGTRFDHAIYISGCTNVRGWACEWNYVYDNSFGRGPQMVINHQNPRCGTGTANKSLASHTMMDNTIDATNYRSRGIGIATFGWEPENTAQEPGIPIIAGNGLINCGYIRTEGPLTDAEGPAMYVSEGGAFIVQNVWTNAQVGVAMGNVTFQANGDDPVWQGVLIADNAIHVDRGEFVRYALPEGAEARVLESNNTETGTPSASPT